jgi:hypothetical protein
LVFNYVPALSGAGAAFILYTSQDVVLAKPVDPSSLALRGSATTIGHGATRISASRNGTLIYYPFGNSGRANANAGRRIFRELLPRWTLPDPVLRHLAGRRSVRDAGTRRERASAGHEPPRCRQLVRGAEALRAGIHPSSWSRRSRALRFGRLRPTIEPSSDWERSSITGCSSIPASSRLNSARSEIRSLRRPSGDRRRGSARNCRAC